MYRAKYFRELTLEELQRSVNQFLSSDEFKNCVMISSDLKFDCGYACQNIFYFERQTVIEPHRFKINTDAESSPTI